MIKHIAVFGDQKPYEKWAVKMIESVINKQPQTHHVQVIHPYYQRIRIINKATGNESTFIHITNPDSVRGTRWSSYVKLHVEKPYTGLVIALKEVRLSAMLDLPFGTKATITHAAD